MNIDIKQNIEEKIRLVLIDITLKLEDDFKRVIRKHSAEGMLRSGNTIKATMNLIAELNEKLYLETLEYIDVLNLKYNISLESDITQLALNAQQRFNVEATAILKKSTELAGNPKLFERMLPEVKAERANVLAKFHNSLNAKMLDLKQNTVKSPLEKTLWVTEFVFLALSIFVSGMWFNEPNGNYEPFLVGLVSVMSLVLLIIKRIGKQ